ncbi:hypothetical protein [Leifsonia sp. EB34]|uniref:hypothetical protein n=1 Tax=Leifsonia sp. EB34 TaxID=3156303 RepID=UPI0035123686
MNAQTVSASHASPNIGELALGAVLADALPSTLLTPDAPERYTVSAVFTRRPTPPEIVAILGPETRDLLTRTGYRTVAVTVSDRRLEISNTNLAELASGLAEVIAQRLHDIGLQAFADQERRAAQLQDSTERETGRARLVELAAGAIRFTAPRAGTTAELGSKTEGGTDAPWFDVNNATGE